MEKHVKYLIIFLFIIMIFVLSATFSAHNDQVVTVNYLIAQSNYKLSSLLAVLFSAGFLLGFITCGIFYLRIRIALKRAEYKIQKLTL